MHFIKSAAISYTITAILITSQLQAQQVFTLDSARQAAQQHYPFITQKMLAQEFANTSNGATAKNFLPQLSLLAQATWQSTVTQVPARIPGFAIEPLSKDQYRAVVDLNQLIYDGGYTRSQQQINNLEAGIREKEIELTEFQLMEQVDNLYFALLLQEQQLQQTASLLKDIDIGITQMEGRVKNGTALRSNLAVLQAERLSVQQRTISLQEHKNGVLEAMSALTGRRLDTGTIFIVPAAPQNTTAGSTARPELQLLESRDDAIVARQRLIDIGSRPRISLFANGGYGRPGLDMLKNDFAPFVTTGVRLHWNISNLYTQKEQRNLIDINRREIAAQKDAFVLNNNAQLAQQNGIIRSLQNQMQLDEEIVALRLQVKEASKAQLTHGVITSADYLREVHEADRAELMLLLHKLQLLQAQINYEHLTGKY